jgi:bifunctional non-homologous end joining protein LigD
VTAFRFIQPCSPIRAKEVPAGDDWLHEVKFDGYRVQAHKMGSRIIIFSRNAHDAALADKRSRLPSAQPFVD